MHRQLWTKLGWVLAATTFLVPLLSAAQSAGAQHSTSIKTTQTPPQVSPVALPQAAISRKPKIDLSYVIPEATVAVVVFPRHVLTRPEMDMVPVEAMAAAVKKEWGLDPVEIEQAVIIAAPDDMPPWGAMILHMASPLAQKEIFAPLRDRTIEDKLDGKAFRRGKGPMDLSFFCPDDRTVLLASDARLLRRMVTSHRSPADGQLTKVLRGAAEPPDIWGVFLAERMRGAIGDLLTLATAPREAAHAIPSLLALVEARADFTDSASMSLTVQATNDVATQQLEAIITAGLIMAQKVVSMEIASQTVSNDPVEQALVRYANRTSERLLEALRPVRSGATLRLATGRGENLRMAGLGALAALVLPAVQPTRDVRRGDDLRELRLALQKYLAACGRFPFKGTILDLIGANTKTPPPAVTESGSICEAFSGDLAVQIMRLAAYFLGFIVLSMVIDFSLSRLRRHKGAAAP